MRIGGARCPTCARVLYMRRWLIVYGAGLALAMFLSHVVGIRVCYDLARSLCGAP